MSYRKNIIIYLNQTTENNAISNRHHFGFVLFFVTFAGQKNRESLMDSRLTLEYKYFFEITITKFEAPETTTGASVYSFRIYSVHAYDM